MPTYRQMTGVEPRWISKFLGHRNQVLLNTALLLLIPLITGKTLDLALACGALIGLVLSPDLDLSYSRLGLFGKISLANEYTFLVPHRAAISHMPLLGTIVRATVVLGVPGIVICLMLGLSPGWAIVLRLFLGLAWADTWHIILDLISSNIVPKRKKR